VDLLLRRDLESPELGEEEPTEKEPELAAETEGEEEEQSQPMSLSSFDEGEEWNKINQIIDSFGADIGHEKEEEGEESSPDCNLHIFRKGNERFQ